MRLKALMLDVDGVLILHPDPGGWSSNLERDLGISKETLQNAFFAKHWHDIVVGRADLHPTLDAALAEIGTGVSSERLVDYWFEHDAHVNHDLLDALVALQSAGPELHLATVQDHARARYLWHVLGFKRHFTAMHYAADLGVAKPDARFFACIEQRTGFSRRNFF